MGAAIISQLESFFGSADFLQILDITNKEAYMDEPNDPFTARQGYLRSVLRCHPEASSLLPTNPDHPEDYKLRCKKLFILQDIYDFLTTTKSEIIKERVKYFDKGEYPKLVSLEMINDQEQCTKRFGIPSFRGVALELKEIFDNQKKKIKEIETSF